MMDAFDEIANQEENAEKNELDMKTLAISDYQKGKYLFMILTCTLNFNKLN